MTAADQGAGDQRAVAYAVRGLQLASPSVRCRQSDNRIAGPSLDNSAASVVGLPVGEADDEGEQAEVAVFELLWLKTHA